MNWIKNFTLVMRSSITTLREKVEDPERMLHQLIIDMEEELERVRSAVAAAIADEIQMNNKCRKARDDSSQWFERAGRYVAAMKRPQSRPWSTRSCVNSGPKDWNGNTSCKRSRSSSCKTPYATWKTRFAKRDRSKRCYWRGSFEPIRRSACNRLSN